jgi:hypothetical protein
MSLTSAIFNKLFFKGTTGAIHWLCDDTEETYEPDGVLLVLNKEPQIPGHPKPLFVEVPFWIENRALADGLGNAVQLKVMSKAIEQGMSPVGFLVDGHVHSPYTKEVVPESKYFGNRHQQLATMLH